ncbi:MAG: tripartite tricarboxylate transporter TctB family protein [Halomonas sp.]|nr:tripartite tricarboxylate transporter TctB family protein [Halomonas sp.]
MNVSRVFLGISGVGVAVLFYVNALEYPDAAAQMPLIYSVTVGLLSLAMVISEMWKKKAASGPDTVDESEPRTTEEGGRGVRGRVSAALVFALAVAYVPLIDVLGYLIATVLFMVATLAVIRTVTFKVATIGIAVLVTVICLVFIAFLGLPIPLLPSFV